MVYDSEQHMPGTASEQSDNRWKKEGTQTYGTSQSGTVSPNAIYLLCEPDDLCIDCLVGWPTNLHRNMQKR